MNGILDELLVIADKLERKHGLWAIPEQIRAIVALLRQYAL